MDNIDAEWIVKAVETVKSGLCNKLKKGNILVYKCATVIRIDIKHAFEPRSSSTIGNANAL